MARVRGCGPAMKHSTPLEAVTDTDGHCMTTVRRRGEADLAVLRAHGVTVEIRYVDQEHAVVRLDAPPARGRAITAARLVCEAMSLARGRGTRHACIALELARPMSGTVLGALQGIIGKDVKSLDFRRAGSSVMVTAALLRPLRSSTVRGGQGFGEVSHAWGAPTSRPGGRAVQVLASERGFDGGELVVGTR